MAQRQTVTRNRTDDRAVYTAEERYSYYVDGNTVRTAVQPVPLEEPRHLEEPKRQRKSRQERALNHARALNLPSIAVMTVSMLAAGAAILSFTVARSELDINARTVRNLTANLQEIKQENDARLLEIEASIDYTDIYNYAVDTLGMVFPGKDQVLWYSSTESEYVSQYEAIPQE